MITMSDYDSLDAFVGATVPDVTLEGFIEASLSHQGVSVEGEPSDGTDHAQE